MRYVWPGLITVLLALLGVGAVSWQWSRLMADSTVAYLHNRSDAEWIRMPQVEGPGTYGKKDFMAAYRTAFYVKEPLAEGSIVVHVFRYGDVFIDGVHAGSTSQDFSQWKTPLVITVRQLSAGWHEIMISIINRTGPPMVMAYSPELDIHTSPDWEVKNHDRPKWIKAISITEPQVNDIGERLPPAQVAFQRTAPVTLSVFVLVFLLTLFHMRLPKLPAGWTAPAVAHWGLLIAWAVLAMNDVIRVPYGLGFDVDAHVQYFQFLMRKHYVPYADQGWQMFQSPLYYFIATPIYALISELLSPTHGAVVVRVISLFCGGMQIHLCYLVAREFFPRQHALQVLGTVLGGLLPINVYQSLNLGNEPLMALFCSIVLLRLYRLVRYPEQHQSLRAHAITGALLGAALLTKATALLLFPVAGFAMLVASYSVRPTWSGRVTYVTKATVVSFGAAAAISAWYYVRNYLRFKKFFVGGWDELRGYIWWQEPGYRIAEQFTSFGYVLKYPLYAALNGFWDGMYSTLWLAGFHEPPNPKMPQYLSWNYDYVLASAWWSLLPTAILLIGAAIILVRPLRAVRSGEILAILCIGGFIFAMASLALRLPSFSTIKATYLLAVITCFPIVAGRGFAPFLKLRLTRALVFGGMAAWAVTVYVSYFVV